MEINLGGSLNFIFIFTLGSTNSKYNNNIYRLYFDQILIDESIGSDGNVGEWDIVVS